MSIEITWVPQLRPGRPDFAIAGEDGETLVIDGESFDLSPLTEGAILPREAIGSPWIAGRGPQRLDGVIRVTLFLSHGVNAPEETRFPPGPFIAAPGPVPAPDYGPLGQIRTGDY